MKAKFLETMAGDFDKKRIVVGAAEYVGRLDSLISKCDNGIQLLLLFALDDCTKEKEVELKLDGSNKKAVQERKAPAKRRGKALFAANKKKDLEVMKRLMERESA